MENVGLTPAFGLDTKRRKGLKPSFHHERIYRAKMGFRVILGDLIEVKDWFMQKVVAHFLHPFFNNDLPMNKGDLPENIDLQKKKKDPQEKRYLLENGEHKKVFW